MLITEVKVGNMNFLDIAVIAIIGLCIFSGYRKGLVKTLYSLFSIFIALFISNKLNPFISSFLREKGGLYDIFTNNILSAMGLNEKITSYGNAAGEKIISDLNFPKFITEKLLEMNTPETYEVLGVTNLENYISGFFANILINIIAGILVFAGVIVIMKVLTVSLDLIVKLPVLKSFNKAGGVIAGFLQGTVYVWIGLIIFTLFFASTKNNFMAILQNSLIAIKFYENNIILNIFFKIFTL